MTKVITPRARLASAIRHLEGIERRLNDLTTGDLRSQVSDEDRAHLYRMELQLQRLRLRTETRLSYRPLPRARRRTP